MVRDLLGLMTFIGGIVFWDRSRFLKCARKECPDEVLDNRKKLDAMLAAMRKLSEKLPEVRQVLNSLGLL